MSVDNNINLDTELKSHTLQDDQDPSLPKMPRCRSGASMSSSPPFETLRPHFDRVVVYPPSLPSSFSDWRARRILPTVLSLFQYHIPAGRLGSTFSDMPAFSMSKDSGLGRRVTEPALNSVPRISLKLHMDYLSAHSTFLRGLFSGASSLDLISSAALSEAPSRPSPSGQFTVPANRLPRLMPCSPDHPILFLPIPDPSSIHLLVHWMYFGSTSYIEDSLNDGSVEWEGIARNVEYLGLPAEIKVFLGRWYGNWLHAERGGASESDGEEEDNDDAETVYYSDDEDQSDDAADPSPAPATVDLNAAMAADDNASDDGQKRGRTRSTRPLSTCSSHSV
ncbi:hypothetical protein MVEN_01373700 [Mycena venus]|uniref:BTB domain-containing protein n=1 Tax=Mycena venus TaxID=2733690 RepID=A0A8H6XY76_9AGAR|nr:hypothetical protein MVEN_01373700 [Mycena venus]